MPPTPRCGQGSACPTSPKLFVSARESDGTPSALEVSICDIDNYPTALDKIAKAIQKRILASARRSCPRLKTEPVCAVGDVDENSPSGSPDVTFPTCSSKCRDAWAEAVDADCGRSEHHATQCRRKPPIPRGERARSASAPIRWSPIVWRKGQRDASGKSSTSAASAAGERLAS